MWFFVICLYIKMNSSNFDSKYNLLVPTFVMLEGLWSESLEEVFCKGYLWGLGEGVEEIAHIIYLEAQFQYKGIVGKIAIYF